MKGQFRHYQQRDDAQFIHDYKKLYNFQFEDAFEDFDEGSAGNAKLSRTLSNQMDLQQAIQESKLAIDYFFNNRFDEAKALMKPENSIYHSVGHSVFLFLEAMLTFVRNPQDSCY